MAAERPRAIGVSEEGIELMLSNTERLVVDRLATDRLARGKAYYGFKKG